MSRLATLTPEEDKAWVFAFTFYLDQGMTDEETDRKAWADLQEAFPRLKAFDGVEN